MSVSKLTYDVIILGGGISGSITAISLKRKSPNASILIIESTEKFPQKIGESTSDITAIILKQLKLENLLNEHPEKSGLRFIHVNSKDGFSEFSSPALRSAINGFQLNRKELDDALLIKAKESGVEVLRPATVVSWQHQEFQNNVQVIFQSNEISLSSKWVVDASGFSRLAKKYLGWKDIPMKLKTSAVYTHVEIPEEKFEHVFQSSTYWKKNAIGSGDKSTIHLMSSHGWWWIIRIDNKTTSIGFVFVNSHYGFENATEFFKDRVHENYLLTQLLEDSICSDIICKENLPHCSQKIYDKGVALIGDTAFFIDPLISPGIEMLLQQHIWISDFISENLGTGNYSESSWRKYQDYFMSSVQSREKIYLSGYQFMDSSDLCRNWLRLGLAGYFGFYIYRAINFPKGAKLPFRINKFSLLLFSLYVKRMNRIYSRRLRLNQLNNSETIEYRNSFVFVSKGWKKHFIPYRMFLVWWWDYITLEFKEIKNWFK